MPQNILLLIHQGFSFAELLVGHAKTLGFTPVILTSQPASEERLKQIQNLAPVHVVPRTHLAAADLDAFWQDHKRADFAGVITVWEGYRWLMAHWNEQLQAPDTKAETVGLLLDKLATRLRLAEHGLTDVRAVLATPEKLQELQASGERYFIKPRRGLGSYGAFRLTPAVQWSVIEGIQKAMRADTFYDGVFSETQDFVIESFLDGIELCFEVIVLQGRSYLLCVHEKVEMIDTGFTTLENASISPSRILDVAALNQCQSYLGEVMGSLGIDYGCFHIEGKWQAEQRRLDLIEINPRIGGSLIDRSFGLLNPEDSILHLWLSTVLQRDDEALATLRTRLAALESRCLARRFEKHSFFRAYFGQAGVRVKSIDWRPAEAAPVFSQAMVKAGDQLPEADREIFIGQALWEMPADDCSEALKTLIRESESTLEIIYE